MVSGIPSSPFGQWNPTNSFVKGSFYLHLHFYPIYKGEDEGFLLYYLLCIEIEIGDPP